MTPTRPGALARHPPLPTSLENAGTSAGDSPAWYRPLRAPAGQRGPRMRRASESDEDGEASDGPDGWGVRIRSRVLNQLIAASLQEIHGPHPPIVR